MQNENKTRVLDVTTTKEMCFRYVLYFPAARGNATLICFVCMQRGRALPLPESLALHCYR